MIKEFTHDILDNLVSRDEMNMFPKYEEREKWESTNPEVREKGIASGERYLDFEWPQLKASTYRQFIEVGLHAGEYHKRFMARRHALGSLFVAECLEGSGRFMDDIINGIFAICEESTWVVPQHIYFTNKEVPMDGLTPCNTAEHIDLFCAETGALLSLCSYIMKSAFEGMSINISSRIKRELEQRIMIPYLKYDSYHWMGYHQPLRTINNWTSWINCNCLITYLFACEDSEMRSKGVEKVIEGNDFYVRNLGPQGGCSEGPGYWFVGPGKLFESMELLTFASADKVNLYTTDKFKNMGSYIYKMYAGNDYTVNFADAAPKVGNGDGGLIYRFGVAAGDETLKAYGKGIFNDNELFGPSHNTFRTYRTLKTIFDFEKYSEANASKPLIEAGFIADIQVAMGRTKENTLDGFFFAVKGGNNVESHNHNDVGQMIINNNGQLVFFDPGAIEYSRQYFAKDTRYTFGVTQSNYHNLPTINGAMQVATEEAIATDVSFVHTGEKTIFTADIAKAYPEEAKVKSWKRVVELDRAANESGVITVTDAYTLDEETDTTWINLMTTREVEIVNNSKFIVQPLKDSPAIEVTFAEEIEEIVVEKTDLTTSKKLIDNWGENIYRIRLRMKDNKLSDTITMKIQESRG